MGKKNTRETLLAIYQRLMACYGPQHWWPADEPFEVIVGAILTQSAAWTNVEKAIANLKAAGALSPPALRQLPASEIAELIHPSGYYNAKARKLKAFVDWFGAEFNDSLDKMAGSDTASLREKLLSVHGIGDETADSILLYAAGKPVFVIDAYTRRIVDRLGLTPKGNSYAAYQALFMDNLPHDTRMFNEYHALLVQLGKDACRKKPRCRGCCLKGICPSFRAR
ncbi:MAG: endonuclease III domain-containing protein [Dehalococcoidia bacterium]|nr:endonuclease III domain-containing protein [Dehalococcoidia bacterium]